MHRLRLAFLPTFLLFQFSAAASAGFIVAAVLAGSLPASADAANTITTITFAEGVVPGPYDGSRHNLTSQYEPDFGVTFLRTPGAQNWSLSNTAFTGSGNSTVLSIDTFTARSTSTDYRIFFTDSVEFVEFDFVGFSQPLIDTPLDLDLFDADGALLFSGSVTPTASSPTVRIEHMSKARRNAR